MFRTTRKMTFYDYIYDYVFSPGGHVFSSMTSALYSYCGPVMTDTQSFRTLKYVLICFPTWHFISWLGKWVGWSIRVRWRGWPSHAKWREGASPLAWKIWLWRSGIMNEWLQLKYDYWTTYERPSHCMWLIIIGCGPRGHELSTCVLIHENNQLLLSCFIVMR
jgi:hypothetical protein